MMESWADAIRSVYGVEVEITRASDPLNAWIPAEERLSATGALDVVTRDFDKATHNHDVTIVAVTLLEISNDDKSLFAIEYLGRALVSSFLVDPTSSNGKPDAGLTQGRTEKLILREVGRLHLKLPYSSDPSDLMYQPMGSVAAIDRMQIRQPEVVATH